MSFENNNDNPLTEKRKQLADSETDTAHANKKPNTEGKLDPQNDTVMNMSIRLETDIEANQNKPILFNGKDINTLSKSQMKKYKKMLSWEANKKDKRKKEKQRAKERKIEARLNNVDLGPSRKQLKLSKMSESQCKTSVIIDISFDELMIPKVIFSNIFILFNKISFV